MEAVLRRTRVRKTPIEESLIAPERAAAPARRGRRWPQGATFTAKTQVLFVGKGTSKGPVHDAVYRRLRHMILNGEIEPCAWLRQEELTHRLGVSRTPIREALRTLSQEGLVEMVTHQGARVAPLSMQAFEELYALRGGIEGLAARLAIDRLAPRHLVKLRRQFRELEMLAKDAPLTLYLRKEWFFRLSLYRVTQRASLLTQVRTLREHAERYLRLAYTVRGRVEESLEFHRRLLNACERGDPVRGERIVQDALRWTVSRAGPIIAASLPFQGDQVERQKRSPRSER
jgi:DNA-binding GntR family transcriptional regulator